MNAFAEAAGWGGATWEPIAGDASNRRYHRLSRGGRSAILMDAPVERGEDVRPFVAITEVLRNRGLSAPEILAADPCQGLLLLEDLGDALFARVCAGDPSVEPELYGAAVDLLASTVAPAPEIPPYDSGVLARESRLAIEWYAEDQTLANELPPHMATALSQVSEDRSALVLRDYHAENLIWLPQRAGVARVGLLDYQDALIGHPAYDLVSLLEDARRDTTAELRESMIARYLARRRDLDAAAFRAAYAALGAQRNLKIIGIFARLCLRDAKPRYLALIPRVWDHLMRDLAHPSLSEVQAVVQHHMPAPEPAALDRLAAQAGSRG
ncbi:MAG: phosphotransferase [Pseudomonadota bacterium]